MGEKRVTGPVQVFVVGFEKFEATARIMAELRKVRKRGVIRLIDVLFVEKDRNGGHSSLADLPQASRHLADARSALH